MKAIFYVKGEMFSNTIPIYWKAYFVELRLFFVT